MNDEKLARVLDTVDPNRRVVLKKLVLAATFSVPIIASFSIRDLANAQVGSGPESTSTATASSSTSTTSVTTPPP